MQPTPPNRCVELAARLRAVRRRIDASCVAAHRDPTDVTLVAVTKTWPVSDIRTLFDLGVADFGENRDQEASQKARHCADLPLIWHFVGQVQTNKCGSIARYAHVVHSVDRARLVRALGAAARRQHRSVTCLVQVDLDRVVPCGPDAQRHGDAAGPDRVRGGAREEEVRAVAEAVAAEPSLRLGGVMTVAPRGSSARFAFERLRGSAAVVRAVDRDAVIVSAGMSGDFEEAVRAGATHLRIGTALLGDRELVVR